MHQKRWENMTLAFTGHRPEKLPWGGEESDERCVALKIQLYHAVETYAQRGYDTFLCGMARGCDFYFAEAVLALAQSRPGLRLEAYLPCPSQPDRWPEPDQRRQRALLMECSAVYMTQQAYTDGCMLRRNQIMVEQCDELLTVFDGSTGGTAAAIRHARSLEIPVTGLWL